MHAGNRCWQIMASRPRRTVNQQTRWTRKIQRKALKFGPGGAFARTFLWKSELRFGRWCFKSGDTKTESTVFHAHFRKKPKEIYSTYRKVWWLDNNRAHNLQRRTWISEQSPIRCRGTSSLNSIKSVSNQNFTGNGEEFTKFLVAVRRSQKLFIRTILLEFGKYCEEWSWNHRTTTLHKRWTSGIAEGAVRRVKEETSAVLLQSGSDDKWWLDSMECCCYL